MTRIVLIAMIVLAAGCSRAPRALRDAPKPGMFGELHYSTDDNSTTERVSYQTRSSDAEIRGAFEKFCEARGMRRDSSPSAQAFGIEWFQSKRESIGLLISRDPGAGTAWVTYLLNE
ncbi:MAG TPA: hypothetical protein VGL53_30100 [Bryobacteraceae bacterium]